MMNKKKEVYYLFWCMASCTVNNKYGQTLGGFIIGSVSNDILYLGKEDITFS